MKKTYIKPRALVSEVTLERYCDGPQVGSGGADEDLTRKQQPTFTSNDKQQRPYGKTLWED